MADDSDGDSWDSKQDEFVKLASKTDPSSNQFQNSQNGICGISNDLYSATRRYHRQQTRKSPTTSIADVRFINPAIYAESLTPSNDDADCVAPTSTDDGTTVVVEVRCGDSNALAEEFSSLSMNDETPRSSGGGDLTVRETADTYRCNRSDTSRTSSLTLTNNSRSVTRLIRRCVINGSSKLFENNYPDSREEDNVLRRFSSNGRRVVQFSSTSLSSSGYSENGTSGLSLARKIAHKEWVQKKERDAKRRSDIERKGELNRRDEEEKIERERLELERKERENFLRWQERKKREEIGRRLAVEEELELQRRLKMVEDSAAIAKIIHLKQWAKKKEDTFKAQQKEEELKRKAIAEERKKRLEESSQAFKKWRESAKSRPRPATQGLLPHHRAKPSFVNPKPWQQIVNDEDTEPQKDLSSKKSTGQTNDNIRKIIASNN